MTDSVSVFQPGERLFNADGAVLAGGSIEFYEAGTSTPKTVYSDYDLSTSLGDTVHLDAGGYPVSAEGGGTKVQIYVGIDPYKVILRDADDVAVATIDDVKGALDTASGSSGDSSTPLTPITTLTSAYTIDEDDAGKLFNCNTTGGEFTVTLPNSTALANGFRVGVRLTTSANAVRITSSGGQTIARPGASSAAVALRRQGEAMWFVCATGSWVVDTYVPPIPNVPGIIPIVDRTNTPPGSPATGRRYIVTTGPTGAWSGFSVGDIAEYDGISGWFRYSPPNSDGWLAFVQDELEYYRYISSAWTQFAHAASDSLAGLIEIASTAEMLAASLTTRAVTPGRQMYHPTHPKAWISYEQVGTSSIGDDYGITSFTDTGVGTGTITFSTAFANTSYAWHGGARGTASNQPGLFSQVDGNTKSTTAFTGTISRADSADFIDSETIGASFVGDWS